MCHLLFRTKREQLNKAFSTYSVDSDLFLDIETHLEQLDRGTSARIATLIIGPVMKPVNLPSTVRFFA